MRGFRADKNNLTTRRTALRLVAKLFRHLFVFTTAGIVGLAVKPAQVQHPQSR